MTASPSSTIISEPHDVVINRRPARELRPAGPVDASILVPTRNRRGWLEKTMADVVSQEYPDGLVEVIISNNVSTKDDTRDWLDAYDLSVFEKRGWGVKIFHHDVTIPIQEHWNFMVEESTGGYFGFHLDDDGWDPSFMRAAVADLKTNPECIVCLMGNRCHWEDSPDMLPGWLGKWQEGSRALVGKLDGSGVYGIDRLLPAFVSRPPFIMSQVVMKRNQRRFDAQDGYHFDLSYVLELLIDGKCYVDFETRCTLRYTNDAYGHADLAATDLENEETVSRALLNLLAKMQRDRVNPTTLRRFATIRSVKALNHFAKSAARRHPDFRHLRHAALLGGGCITGWRLANNVKLSQDDK